MTGARVPLWLGDLAKVDASLQPKDERTRRRIAALLGLEPDSPRLSRRSGGADGPSHPKAERNRRDETHSDSSLPENLRPATVESLTGRGHAVRWQAMRVVVGYVDGAVEIYDPNRDEPLFRGHGDGGGVQATSVSADGRYAVTLFAGSTPLFSDLSTNQHHGLMPLEYGRATAVAMTPDGRFAAIGTEAGDVVVWALPAPGEASPSNRRVLSVFSDTVTALAFSPDGRQVAAGASSGAIDLWDVDGNRRLHTLYFHTRSLTALAFLPDSRRGVSGSADGTVSIWDTLTGALVMSVRARRDDLEVRSIAISPDGRKALSTSAGGPTLWDLGSGRRTDFPDADQGSLMVPAFDAGGSPVIVQMQGRTLELLALNGGEKAPTVIMARLLPAKPSIIVVAPNRLPPAGAAQEPLSPSAPWTPGDPPGEPPIAPHRLPTMLRDMLATESADGPPDIDLLVERLARGEPISALPRQKQSTLRRGVQVLEDWSRTTLPFRRDMEAVRRQLNRLFPVAPSVLRFRGLPDADGLVSTEVGEREYQPPRAQTPVLVIGGPADLDGKPTAGASSVAQWRPFALRLTKSGCPLVVLSPFATASRAPTAPSTRLLSGRFVAWEQTPPPIRLEPVEAEIREPGPDAPFALHALWRQDPQAFRLAVLLSLATRVEPRLVRAMRRRVLPRMELRTEAVLWQSDVVYAAAPEAFEFTDDAQRALFLTLARDKVLLDAAWQVTRACHPSYPQILAMEEEARYRGLRRWPDDKRWLDEQFQRVAATLSPERRGLANWATRVRASLPEASQRAFQKADVPALAHSVLTRRLDRGAQLFVDWGDSHRTDQRCLVLRLEKNGARSAEQAGAIEAPAGSPLLVDLHTGPVGARRRQKSVLLFTGVPKPVTVPVQGSVELTVGNGGRWIVRDKRDIAVVIGHYKGDEALALQLAKDLRRRGVIVDRLIDITTQDGATEATRAASGAIRGIALLGPAARPHINRPGLHTRGPEPVLASKGLLPSDLPDRLRSQKRFDLNLPVTGLANLLRELDNPTGEHGDFQNVQESPEPKGWPLARVHGRPSSKNITVWPALKGVLKALDQPYGFIRVSSVAPEERHAAAISLGLSPLVRRRFPDGVFYIPGFVSDPATWALDALELPVDRLRKGESLRVAHDVFHEGRCLVIIEEKADSGDPARFLFTGPNGRTILLGDPKKPFVTRDIQPWRLSKVGINAMADTMVHLRYANGDETLAARLAFDLQSAGMSVLTNPLGVVPTFFPDPELLVFTPRSATLLAGMASAPLGAIRSSIGPFFVLHRGLSGQLPKQLVGATRLDMRRAGWTEQLARLLDVDD